jgi:hypothetical protein
MAVARLGNTLIINTTISPLAIEVLEELAAVIAVASNGSDLSENVSSRHVAIISTNTPITEDG